eukprot:294928-Pyramimonas_sp.AAC.1
MRMGEEDDWMMIQDPGSTIGREQGMYFCLGSVAWSVLVLAWSPGARGPRAPRALLPSARGIESVTS